MTSLSTTATDSPKNEEGRWGITRKKTPQNKKNHPKVRNPAFCGRKNSFLEEVLKVILSQFRLSLCLTFAFWDKDNSRLTAAASRLEQQQQYSIAHFNRFKDLKKKWRRGGVQDQGCEGEMRERRCVEHQPCSCSGSSGNKTTRPNDSSAERKKKKNEASTSETQSWRAQLEGLNYNSQGK